MALAVGVARSQQATAGSAATAVPAPALAAQIQALLAAPELAQDHWGIAVATLQGTRLYGLNEAQLLPPASTTKLFTTAAALALLGPERRWTTRLSYPAPAPGTHVVHGDVVLLGAGDASLNGRALPLAANAATDTATATATDAGAVPSPTPKPALEDFADQLVAAGVRRIEGNIVGDDTAFPWEPYPPEWAVSDTMWGYGAPISGLSVQENQVQVVVSPGRRAGAPAQVRWVDTPSYGGAAPPRPERPRGRMRPFYAVDARALTTVAAGGTTQVGMDLPLGSRVLRVFGTIAEDATPVTEPIAIADPAEYAARLLTQLLRQRGVVVQGRPQARHAWPQSGQGLRSAVLEPLHLPTTPESLGAAAVVPPAPSTPPVPQVCRAGCPVVLQNASPTVAEDVVLTNKVSENLHAELLLRHLGKEFGSEGSNTQGVRVLRQFARDAGVAPGELWLEDGSGLSGHDRATPQALVQLLVYAASQPWFEVWKQSLPVGGVDGTLRSRFAEQPLTGRVFAKTGTLAETRALAGYVVAASGHTVAFAVMVGDHLPGSRAEREAMDRVVAAIAATY
ncbi:MAG: D-alanyl-D-alanine carboxypeptidase/D-alanyl-D-alanine-endopeptidase [Acidobacteriota bacterium]|nr:D-alanyl-D-alanine carboxypeptidase/D-alanyl-D-alanine-endopeptidase [Acidobacteriota bacterium]